MCEYITSPGLGHKGHVSNVNYPGVSAQTIAYING